MFCSVSAHIWWRVVVGDQFQHNIVTIRDFQFLPSFGWFFDAQNAPKTVILPESQKIEPRSRKPIGTGWYVVPARFWSLPTTRDRPRPGPTAPAGRNPDFPIGEITEFQADFARGRDLLTAG